MMRPCSLSSSVMSSTTRYTPSSREYSLYGGASWTLPVPVMRITSMAVLMMSLPGYRMCIIWPCAECHA